MPRLGVSEGDGGSNNNNSRAPPAHAYHHSYPTRRANLWTLCSIIFTTFLLRNLFLKDYRQEEIARLKAAGKTDAEIEMLFPKPKAERVKAARDDYLSLKYDVLKLKNDVQILREKVVVLEQIGLLPDESKRGNINGNGTDSHAERGPHLKGSATKDEIE